MIYTHGEIHGLQFPHQQFIATQEGGEGFPVVEPGSAAGSRARRRRRRMWYMIIFLLALTA